MADPLADYRVALSVTVQWLETWKATGDPRARETAMACAKIAHERFAALERSRDPGRDYHDLMMLERRAQFDALGDEVRATLAESRNLLEQWQKT
jgi:hypothetical protein